MAKRRNKHIITSKEFDDTDTLWNTARYRLYNCKHVPIRLGNYGLISGGCQESDNIALYIYFSNYSMPNILIDSHGKVKDGKVRVIYMPIEDGCIPSDYKNYARIAGIAYEYLKRGKNVHVQCMSGHGRTGTFIACLIGRYMSKFIPKGIELVDWIRKIYCRDAVEGYSQHMYVSEFTHTKEPDIKDYTKWNKLPQAKVEKQTWNYFWCPDCDKSGYTEIVMSKCPACESNHVESHDINSFEHMKDIGDTIK